MSGSDAMAEGRRGGIETTGIDRRTALAAAAVLAIGGGIVRAAPAEAAQGPQGPPLPAGCPPPHRGRIPAPGPDDGGVSAILARHVANARYEQLDAGAVARAKLRLLDVIGCAIGGLRGEGQTDLSGLLAAGTSGEASVFGTGRKAAAQDAAMANAVLARTWDFEVMTVQVRDVLSPSHHAPTTVMTALALAEQGHANGRDFLTAMSVGDDFAARSIAASGIDFNDGWDGVPLHATMAAAAIAANAGRLSPAQTREAIALAADQIGGTVQNVWDGGNSWKILQGSAARNGILAAKFAAAGWSGMTDPLLSPCGFYAQFTSGCARPDLLTAGLGQEWNGEVYFKPYPSCAANHPTIEAALNLRARTRLDPAQIDNVTIRVGAHVLGLFIVKPLKPGPSAHSQANFSLRFACANALLRGSLRQEHYAPAAMAEPALGRLVERTRVEALPRGAQGVIVEVRLRDGTMASEALTRRARRYPEVEGTTPAEVEAKFRQQVAFAGNVPAALADQIVRRIAAIEAERDMAGFASLVARATRFPA